MRETLGIAWTVLAAAALAACSGSELPDRAKAKPGQNDEPATEAEPPLETDPALLDAALVCTPFTHPDKPPVLLVHGTFTNGYEQYDWTYLPLLDERGFDVCAVTYPDRGLGDQQISAEYVVNAIRRIHAATGRKVAMIGHSQGAGMPRWALKWWPSARDAVEDFVPQAAPHHGITIASFGTMPTGQPEASFQFAIGSNFVAALNRGDEAPGGVDYSNIYTQFDELVQPVSPVPTAALDYGQDNRHVANILIQDICPGRVVDHVTVGTTDRVAFELAVDAISNPGPANVERAGGTALCGLAPIVPDQIVPSTAVQAMLGIMAKENRDSFPDPHMTDAEPPLKPYAQAH